MTPQKTIYITVYLLLLIPTLSIALVTRIFSLKVMLLDGFSGNIIFLITCILCAVLYLIFKTTIDGYILPFLCKCSKIQLAVAESVTKEVTNQEPKEEANLPSYQEHYDAVAEKKRIEAEETLQRVLDYTMSELVHDMNESDMMTLCNYIREFQFGTASDIAQTTQRIRLTSDIKIIDLYHFGWNIGNQYNKSGMEIAQFLKNVFAEKLYDTEVTTIVRKLRMSGTCRIKIKSEI
jgi:hypothetical protein